MDGPPRDADRRIGLKAMFDPKQGNMGEYARFLVAAAKYHPGVDRLLDRVACKYKTLDEVLDTLIPGDMNLSTVSRFVIERRYPKIVTCNITNPQAGIFIASETLRTLAAECYQLHAPGLNTDILDQLPEKAKSAFERLNVSGAQKRMMETFDRHGSLFTRSPDFIVSEAISTVMQVIRWVCMHSKTPQEIQNQTNAMLQPTQKDPFGRPISPLEMLGRGENGTIGRVIDYRYITHIDGEEIVRQVDDPCQSLFHPKFVEFWFEREQGIGGCPALSHRKQAGEIYMEFGQMFVDMVARAENVRARLANTPTQSQKSGSVPDNFHSAPR